MKILFSLLAFLFICLMRPFPRGGGHGKCACTIQSKYNERNMKLLPICIHYAIYSFISKRTNSKKERPI